jgi:hypothetical protein
MYITGADTFIAGTSWIHFHIWYHYSGNHNDAICFSVFVTWGVWLERSMLRSVMFWMKDRKFKMKCFGQIMNRPSFIHPDFAHTHTHFQGDLYDWAMVSFADKEKLTFVIQKVHWRSMVRAKYGDKTWLTSVIG